MRLSFADVLVFVGLVMAGLGIWLYDPRLSLLVIGVVLFGLGIVGSR